MNIKKSGIFFVILLTTLAWNAFAVVEARKENPSTQTIEKLTGLRGTLNEVEGVYKISLPRDDIKITVDGWTLPPFMGLTSWVAFMPSEKQKQMVMGDLVLFEDEVNPVMSIALENGLSVTALHNHFFFNEPRVFFMHIGGEGDLEKLALAVRKIVDKQKEIRTANPQPASSFGGEAQPQNNAITAKTLEDILGFKGQGQDGMLKVAVGRKVKMPSGCVAGKEMGVNSWAAFAGTDDNAIVDGDLAVLEEELQPILKTLRKAGIHVVAIHQHMVQETPRMMFVHFWGKGKAADLARGIDTALRQINN